jgi:NAD(P)-dependent dehydrogenase (short-subunit alcohol dehydrogenase family)
LSGSKFRSRATPTGGGQRRDTADPCHGCHRPREDQGCGGRTRRQTIDLLLNNAGIIGPRGQTIGNIDYEAWAKVLDVNTMGPMRVSEAFVDHVARSERKLIVTLTSGMGSLADNSSGGSIAYRSSKAAVNMVMRSLAIDLTPRGNPGGEREGVETVDRDAGASAVRKVLQLRRSRIRLVGIGGAPMTNNRVRGTLPSFVLHLGQHPL